MSLADRETEKQNTHNIKAKAKVAILVQRNVVQKSVSRARSRCFEGSTQNL